MPYLAVGWSRFAEIEEWHGAQADGRHEDALDDDATRQNPAVSEPVTEDEPAKPSTLRSLSTVLGEAALAVVVALVITALLRVFVFQVFQVPSGSMEHTLELGDRIVAVRVADFQRGDVVVFEDPPAQWMGPQPASTNPARRALEGLQLLPDSTQGYLVKRVIGLPGDHVSCCDQSGQLTINGVPVDETSFLYTDASGATVNPSDIKFDIVVPAGHLFMMGDHRDRSGDSRIHLCEPTPPGVPAGMNGVVPVEDVVGPVTLIVLPLGRIQTFSTPESYSVVPPPGQDPPPAPVLGEGTCTTQR